MKLSIAHANFDEVPSHEFDVSPLLLVVGQTIHGKFRSSNHLNNNIL